MAKMKARQGKSASKKGKSQDLTVISVINSSVSKSEEEVEGLDGGVCVCVCVCVRACACVLSTFSLG